MDLNNKVERFWLDNIVTCNYCIITPPGKKHLDIYTPTCGYIRLFTSNGRPKFVQAT